MPVWFITPGLNVVVLVWHSVHACVVGMWLAGLPPVTPVVNDVVELWQVAHSPVVGWFGSCAAVGRVTIVTPKKLLPVSWQVAHAVADHRAWFIGVPAKRGEVARRVTALARRGGRNVVRRLGLEVVTPVKLLPAS